jgi:hypothetical protein
MKKIVRVVWISALSGLAFLASCCSVKGLTRDEKKKLLEEKKTIEEILAERARFNSKTDYMLVESQLEYYNMLNRLDSINFRLGEDVDLAKNVRRRELLYRIDSLQAMVSQEESARVYGSPEIFAKYKRQSAARIDQLEAEIKNTREELEALDQSKEPISTPINRPVVDPRKSEKSPATVYGPPPRYRDKRGNRRL